MTISEFPNSIVRYLHQTSTLTSLPQAHPCYLEALRVPAMDRLSRGPLWYHSPSAQRHQLEFVFPVLQLSPRGHSSEIA